MRFFRFVSMLVAVVGAAGAGFAGTVSVTTDAAHDEVYGMAVFVDGKGDKGYAEDHHPNGEKIYRADFWFHPGDMQLAAKTGHIIFQVVGANPTGAGTDVRVVEVELQMRPKNKMKVRALSYNDAQPKQKKTATRSMRIDNTGWNRLVLEWRAATSNGSPDGFTRLSIAGGKRSGSQVEISGRVTNQGLAVDKQRMGVVRGVDDTTHGTSYYDTFASFRSLGSQ